MVYILLLLFHFKFRGKFIELAENPSGIKNERFWDFVLYVIHGIVITWAVQITGIVVVFSCLIIPATISACFSNRLGVQLVIIWLISVTASIAGLLFAYYLDFSIGPSISMFLGCGLIIVGLVRKLQRSGGVNDRIK